jgi:uncharacterized protein YigE (DUF2233 family)
VRFPPGRTAALFATLLSSLLPLLLLVAARAEALPVYVAGRGAQCFPAPVEAQGQLMVPVTFMRDWLGLDVAAGRSPGSWKISTFGRYLVVRKDSSKCLVHDFTFRAGLPARVVEGRLYVPIEMLMRAFGVLWSRDASGFHIQPPGAAINEVRQGEHETGVRVVLDLSGPAAYRVTGTPGDVSVEVSPPAELPQGWGAHRLYVFPGSVVPKVKLWAMDGNWTRVAVGYTGTRMPRVYTLGSPPRIVVDVPREASLAPAPDLAPPVVVPELPPVPPLATPWQLRTFATERGPVRVFALTANPTAIRVALAGDTIRRRRSVRSIAADHGAPAAVNGGYFAAEGPPLGLLVSGGEWVKHPMYGRCALGITKSGKAVMGRVRFGGTAVLPRLGTLALTEMNTTPWREESVVLYTWRWGLSVAGTARRPAALLRGDGTVLRVEKQGRAVGIPRGQWLLTAGGAPGRLLGAVRQGGHVKLRLDTTPDWPALAYAVGAGPQLISRGQRNVTADTECFRPDVCGIASRTAVGIAGDGNVVVAAGEGGAARGLSLWELATVMLKLGCREAMALDGGGSTTVVGNGKVLNAAANGGARQVSNALLIYGQVGGR